MKKRPKVIYEITWEEPGYKVTFREFPIEVKNRKSSKKRKKRRRLDAQ